MSQKPLKILLCLNPFREKDHPASFHTYWIQRTDMFFGPVMKETNFEFGALLNDEQKTFWKGHYPDSYAAIKKFISLSPEQMRIFPDSYDATHKWFSGNYGPEHLEKMTGLVKSSGMDAPDLCIVFYHQAPYVAAAFPSAKIVYFYEGGFSRYPYMPTWRFDRGGCVKNADTRELAALKGTPSEKTSAFMDKFRASIGNAIDAWNPFKADAQEWRKKYKSLVLLPLQLSGRPAFDCLCDFENQIDYLAAVMDKMPLAVGVVVTEHPEYPQITDEIHRDMTKRYPNFIYRKSFLEVENSSFFLAPLVDAVITVSSSVMWHAMLEGKIACVLGDSDSWPLADCRTLDELARALDEEKPDSKRFGEVFYALLTRYWIPETLMKDPVFMRTYLENLGSGGRMTILPDEDLLALAAETAGKFHIKKRDLARHFGQRT